MLHTASATNVVGNWTFVPDDQLVGAMVRRAAAIARENGYDASGYRTVFNTNAGAG